MYKPPGYTSVAPYLVVDGAQKTVDFLRTVFEAEMLRSFLREDDPAKVQHCELRIDDTVLMVSDAVQDWPAVPAHVHIFARDVDGVYARALQAGATAVREPKLSPDGDKRGGFLGPCGITWWVTAMPRR